MLSNRSNTLMSLIGSTVALQVDHNLNLQWSGGTSCRSQKM